LITNTAFSAPMDAPTGQSPTSADGTSAGQAPGRDDGPASIPPAAFVCILAFRERKPILRRKPKPDGKRRKLPLLRRRKPRPHKPSKFIMIYNQRRGWELPGGGIAEGETPEQAASREFFEETGYEVSLVDRVPSKSGFFYIGRLGRRHGMPADKDVKEVRFLRDMPQEGLAFPYDEYAGLLKTARERGF